MADSMSYLTDGFNDKLHGLVFDLVDGKEDAGNFIKIMLLIQEQVTQDDMHHVAGVASQFAYEQTTKHARRTFAYIEKVKAELLAEFAGNEQEGK